MSQVQKEIMYCTGCKVHGGFITTMGWNMRSAGQMNSTPLLIFEAFSSNYQWATDRSHTFMMRGMKGHLEFAEQRNLNYITFSEKEAGQIDRMLMNLCKRVAILITDEFPVLIVNKRNQRYSGKVGIPYVTVDSNGLIPLGLTDKDPYSAYLFRKVVQ